MKNQNVSNQKNCTIESANTCGNCWGHQEWDGQAIDKEVDRTKSASAGFILKFVKKYFPS